MDAFDPHVLSVGIRWLHVVAMAVALGGSVLLALTIRSARSPEQLDAVIGYERAFWIAAGVLAMTGIGNAAAFGVGLPGPESSWGSTFTLKLVGVLVLVLISLPRTIVVSQLARRTDARGASSAVLGNLYGVTALWLVATLALAVWIAHA